VLKHMGEYGFRRELSSAAVAYMEVLTCLCALSGAKIGETGQTIPGYVSFSYPSLCLPAQSRVAAR